MEVKGWPVIGAEKISVVIAGADIGTKGYISKKDGIFCVVWYWLLL
jgi:hypothetical protein